MRDQSRTVALRLNAREVELLNDLLPGLLGSGRRTEDSYYLPYAHYLIVGFLVEEGARLKYECNAENLVEDLINILHYARDYPAIRRYYLEIMMKELYQIYEQKNQSKGVPSDEEG